MDGHQSGGHKRERHAMQHIESQQCRCSDETPTEQCKSYVAPRMEQRQITQLDCPGERPLVPGPGCCPGHVRADGDCPDGELIPRKQVPGKAEQQGELQKDDPHPPVELTRRLVAARQEHTVHM